MAKYSVNASIHASAHLGEWEAESAEEAKQKALEANGFISVCHQCADSIIDPEIDEIFVDLIEDNTEVTCDE